MCSLHNFRERACDESDVESPSDRLHKPSGQAIVVLGSRTSFLGRHNSIESRNEYDRLIAEWRAQGRGAAPARGGSDPADDLTITELIPAYYRQAERFYRKN